MNTKNQLGSEYMHASEHEIGHARALGCALMRATILRTLCMEEKSYISLTVHILKLDLHLKYNRSKLRKGIQDQVNTISTTGEKIINYSKRYD